MRLKQLELQGFKTFASKTEFVFPTGVTAIVGPNGSGKSNVADSIRWVLGEQVFSVLRAKKTEDLIFAGGDGRPRAGMAEVYLTFDNADGFFPIDYSEVVVGRRAYRDGQNEYILNGSKVRLRDISELLSKTGLARRTYTVIGQGLVDQALSINSDERRSLFEEAAGISMYRYKREDALRKLDETHRNLDRVRDILAEIGPRVRQLERQAQRTSDYARLSAELNEMQRTWFGYHWGKGQAALREARATVEAQSALLAARRAEMTDYNSQIEALRRQQLELRSQINSWQRDSSGLHTQIESVQRELAVLAERARSLQQQADQLQLDNAPLEAQVAAQADQVAQAEQDLAEAAARFETQASAIAEAQQAVTDRQAQRETIVQTRAATQQAILKAQTDLADRRNRRQQLAERQAALQGDVQNHQRDIDAQAQRRRAIETQRAALESELNTLQARQADLTQQLEALERQTETARRQADQLAAELDQARAQENRVRERYAVLSEVRASLSQFDAGTRLILNANLPGVRGVLAALIDVEPEWERAIEVALGPDIQTIVVDSWSVAPAVLEKLGNNRGRVSLLPLDALQVERTKGSNNQSGLFANLFTRLRGSSSDRPSLPRGLRRAADCITCSPEVRPAIEALLGQVVVADSLAQARELRVKLPEGFDIAVRTGELLRSTGAVTLGQAGESGDLIAREREWRNLPDDLQVAAARTTQAADRQQAALKAVDDLARQSSALAQQTQPIEAAINVQTDQLREIDHQLADVQREIEWQQSLIDQLQTEQTAIDQRDDELRVEALRLNADLTHLSETIIQLDAQLVELPLEALAARVSALQAEAAVADQLRRSRTDIVASYTAALEQTRAQLRSRADRLTQIAGEQQSIETQLAGLRAREKALQTELVALADKVDPTQQALLQLEAAEHHSEADERSARTRLSELESLYNQAQIELARKEEELNHLHARIDEELGLVQLEMADLSGPQPLPLKPIVSELPIVEQLPEGMDQELQRLKAHIRRLGPINPEAQQEYEESRERFQFLTQQSIDLEQAIEQLNQVISELDVLMDTSFRETFEAIAEEFKNTFQLLFGGGSAKLVLTDPENMGSTGIEIIARPPGKKQQGLALLSGGERSLTAAALMFAILKIKPPPFCILDETDAALDEANVGRFRETVQSLSHDTQFVLITHNRGTIEAADTIYGISMSSDSASRAISLKLENVKLNEQ